MRKSGSRWPLEGDERLKRGGAKRKRDADGEVSVSSKSHDKSKCEAQNSWLAALPPIGLQRKAGK